MSNDARLTTLTDAVLGHISNRFEEGSGGELLLTSPFDGETMYDLYPSAAPQSYVLIINDEPTPVDGPHASLDVAKRRVAGLMA